MLDREVDAAQHLVEGWPAEGCVADGNVEERSVGFCDEQAGLGSPGVDELRWLKPVYPGDTLHVRGKILDKTPSRSKPEIGSFRTETTVTNQDDVPVMRFTSIVLIRRRPEGQAA